MHACRRDCLHWSDCKRKLSQLAHDDLLGNRSCPYKTSQQPEPFIFAGYFIQLCSSWIVGDLTMKCVGHIDPLTLDPGPLPRLWKVAVKQICLHSFRRFKKGKRFSLKSDYSVFHVSHTPEPHDRSPYSFDDLREHLPGRLHLARRRPP